MTMLKRSWIGVVIILVGLGFLLQQADVFQFTTLLADWWPLIFVVVGVIQLVYRTQTSFFTGPLFLIIGILLLLNQWTDIQFLSYLWPLIIIYIGIIFVFYQGKHDESMDDSQILHSLSLFSGSEIISRSSELKGGSVTAIFGGAEIDLREAIILDEQITLELTSLFGGISLKIPPNVRVQVSGIPIFGGWEDKTRHREADDDLQPLLLIKCVTIFGGVEISD